MRLAWCWVALLVARDVGADCTVATRCMRVIARARATSLVAGPTHVFWTTATGTISSAPKYTFGVPTLVAQEQDPAVLDGTDGQYVYWHTPSVVRRAPDMGGAPQLLYSYGPNGPCIVAVYVTPSTLYVNNGSHVWGESPDGTTPSKQAQMVADAFLGREFVVAAQTMWSMPIDLNAYAEDSQHGPVALISLSHGNIVRARPLETLQVLATQQDIDGRLALQGDDVYWTNPTSGVVRKMSVYGGGIDVIATGQHSLGILATDADSVYWTTGDAIVRVTPR